MPRQILRLVLSQGTRLVVTGIILGLIASAGATRLLQSLLVGVSPLDPRIFLLAALSFLLVATVACLLPARRAASIDPTVALRDE
jgi:ABC-type antimicrobial peptide transport system permease subunit